MDRRIQIDLSSRHKILFHVSIRFDDKIGIPGFMILLQYNFHFWITRKSLILLRARLLYVQSFRIIVLCKTYVYIIPFTKLPIMNGMTFIQQNLFSTHSTKLSHLWIYLFINLFWQSIRVWGWLDDVLNLSFFFWLSFEFWLLSEVWHNSRNLSVKDTMLKERSIYGVIDDSEKN